MAHFVIYTKAHCPYCTRAKKLLGDLGHTYEEKNIAEDPALREELVSRVPHARTVPQIFIGEHSIGGHDDLKALVESNGLDGVVSLNS